MPLNTPIWPWSKSWHKLRSKAVLVWRKKSFFSQYLNQFLHFSLQSHWTCLHDFDSKSLHTILNLVKIMTHLQVRGSIGVKNFHFFWILKTNFALFLTVTSNWSICLWVNIITHRLLAIFLWGKNPMFLNTPLPPKKLDRKYVFYFALLWFWTYPNDDESEWWHILRSYAIFLWRKNF